MLIYSFILEDVRTTLELYELRQFITFADTGTLSEAADILHLSQPALSRNMKKLEDDLGIPLFERKKNKLELNQNGLYVLDLAKKLLDDADFLAKKARDFDRKNRTISLGTCAPAPLWTLSPLLSNVYPHMSHQTEMDREDRLLERLENGTFKLIVIPERPSGDQFFYIKCGKETLMFALPKGHKFARRKSLTFADMNGENMLLMPDIGFWAFVIEKMPDSRFLTQSDRFSFNELVQAFSLPSFITDISKKYREIPPGRVYVPISDPEATLTYYLVCRNVYKNEFKTLFELL